MEATTPPQNDEVRQHRCPAKKPDKGLATCTTPDRMFKDLELDKEPVSLGTGGGAANRPHPMLETPVIYNILKRFAPSLLDRLRDSYAFRWRLSYPLQRRLPYSQFLDEKLKLNLTWGELLLVLPFCLALVMGIISSVVYPSVSLSGRVARAALIASVTLAGRTNSLATFLLGMPYDRALYYHKLAGKLAGIASLMHLVAFFLDPKFFGSRDLFANQVNFSGTLMLALLVGVVVVSLPYVRRMCYEVFYTIHRVFAVGMVVGAFFHSGTLVPLLAALTWGLDVLLRRTILTNKTPIEATISLLSDSVVQLSFDKGSFDYNPGQYVYISVPELSWLQWHPFSIRSSPHEDTIQFHIRNVGDWTGKLHRLAQVKDTVSIFIQGPYGNLGVDLLAGDRKYKSVVLVSGGIGITPMQSVLQQLLEEHKTSLRTLDHVLFLWIERDPEFLMHESEVILETAKYTQDNLSSRLALAVVDQDDHVRGTRLSSFNPGTKAVTIDIQIYLTRGTIPPNLSNVVQQGRPNLPDIFADLATQQEGKVAVLASAPHSVMDICRSACVGFSDDSVRFDFHSESMAI